MEPIIISLIYASVSAYFSSHVTAYLMEEDHKQNIEKFKQEVELLEKTILSMKKEELLKKKQLIKEKNKRTLINLKPENNIKYSIPKEKSISFSDFHDIDPCDTYMSSSLKDRLWYNDIDLINFRDNSILYCDLIN